MEKKTAGLRYLDLLIFCDFMIVCFLQKMSDCKKHGKPEAPPLKSSIIMAIEIQMVLPDRGDSFLKIQVLNCQRLYPIGKLNL